MPSRSRRDPRCHLVMVASPLDFAAGCSAWALRPSALGLLHGTASVMGLCRTLKDRHGAHNTPLGIIPALIREALFQIRL
jgi:hypothetical protein